MKNYTLKGDPVICDVGGAGKIPPPPPLIVVVQADVPLLDPIAAAIAAAKAGFCAAEKRLVKCC